MDQIGIALFGLTALFLALNNWETGRKWAPIIGLLGQPFWVYFALKADGYGILLLTLAYTIVYINGVYLQWIKK